VTDKNCKIQEGKSEIMMQADDFKYGVINLKEEKKKSEKKKSKKASKQSSLNNSFECSNTEL
jgi:hypothetical protein